MFIIYWLFWISAWDYVLLIVKFIFEAANFRSISAVDANAVQRARVRAQYSTMSRLKMTPGTGASLRK